MQSHLGELLLLGRAHRGIHAPSLALERLVGLKCLEMLHWHAYPIGARMVFGHRRKRLYLFVEALVDLVESLQEQL